MRSTLVMLLAVVLLSACKFRIQTEEESEQYRKAMSDSLFKADIARYQKQAQESFNKTQDSLYQLVLKGELYYTTIVRVGEGKPQFMYYSGDDSRILQIIDSGSRENFYKNVRIAMDKDLLKAHELAWGLEELKPLQKGDGGVGTIITNLIDTPTVRSSFYIFNLFRFNSPQDSILPDTVELPRILVNIKTAKVLFQDKRAKTKQ